MVGATIATSMPTLDPICERIRSRRAELGLSLAKLAVASGLKSSAYVLYIESGKRVPSEEVAARIAEALGEDPALFVAWSRARSRGDLGRALDGARTLERLLAGDASIAPGGPVEAAPRATDEPTRLLAPSTATRRANEESLVHVPVLVEGTVPGTAEGVRAMAIETLRLDPGAFPPGPPPATPFAYRLSAHGARRVSDALRPGDCVVLSRDVDAPMEDAIYAVRVGARVELARVRLAGSALHLRRGDGLHEADPVPAASDTEPLAAIVGKVVLALRRWL
jgi:transcriptional regulator with XRE-family HTH domain